MMMSRSLPTGHFLNQSRPDVDDVRLIHRPDGFVDTTTLAAHDFDVDTRTGFMPPDPPISRLPIEWEPWEKVLDEAMSAKLQLAVKPGLTQDEIARSASWRERVRNDLPVLSTKGLTASELLLRRAHHVLTFVMHMYIHTLPLDAAIRIPPSISIPLLRVSARLQLPPIATYSDTVLYNWTLKSPLDKEDENTTAAAAAIPPAPTLDNLRSQDLFTGTTDEQEFYLASSRIELRGVQALEVMRATMDEMFVGDDIAVRRITAYLHTLARVVDDLAAILLRVRDGCDPHYFYHAIRPWFRGEDSDPANRKWVFEGLEEEELRADSESEVRVERPTDLSGPSAGQSALIHALDIFLGVDNCGLHSSSDGKDGDDARRTLLRRMQIYMPRHHRNFLRHLTNDPRPVRNLVVAASGSMEENPELVEAYNDAVRAVKGFRDAHIRIVALYIIGPASEERRAIKGAEEKGSLKEKDRPPLKGTGGTHLAQFLRGVRDKTAEAMIDR